MGNCPVGDRLAQPCPSLGAFCFPRLPGGAEQGKLAPPGCCAMPSRFGAAGPACQGREGRELLTEGLSGGASVWGERAGPCLPPQGWAGHGSGRQWVCSTRPVGLCRGGLPQRPLVLPPPPPPPCSRAGLCGGWRCVCWQHPACLPTLCSSGTWPLSSPHRVWHCRASGTPGRLVSTSCRHNLPGC